MDHSPQLIIRKSRRKALCITLAGFLIGIAGGLVLMYGQNSVVGWCAVITAAFTLLLGFGSLYDRKPYLVLTDEGITETTTVREQIEWAAILHADDFYFRGQYIVRLLLDRAYKPQTVRPTWFWRFDRLYAQQGVKAIFIRTAGLEVNAAQLVALIERMRVATPDERAELLRQGPNVWQKKRKQREGHKKSR